MIASTTHNTKKRLESTNGGQETAPISSGNKLFRSMRRDS